MMGSEEDSTRASETRGDDRGERDEAHEAGREPRGGAPPAAARGAARERSASAAAALEGDPADTARRVGRGMFVLAWLLALGLGTLLADGWLDRRERARAPREVIAAGVPVGLELRADASGHYFVEGSVEGSPVRFLVDTGASAVAIPEPLARRLGLERGRPERVATANGAARVWRTTLDAVALGPLVRRDVPAYITPGMDGETALLGMSFLRHYELVQRDGRLLIRGAGNV